MHICFREVPTTPDSRQGLISLTLIVSTFSNAVCKADNQQLLLEKVKQIIIKFFACILSKLQPYKYALISMTTSTNVGRITWDLGTIEGLSQCHY